MESEASLLNDGGIIRIDRTDETAIVAETPVSMNITNQNGGQILIGQGDGNIGGLGISLEDESTLTNDDSIIKINDTSDDGIYLSASDLFNSGNSLLEIKKYRRYRPLSVF